jgi:hypothetical protein
MLGFMIGAAGVLSMFERISEEDGGIIIDVHDLKFDTDFGTIKVSSGKVRLEFPAAPAL